ncbi:hypothetical protein ADICYQ_4101 [Cyclobacterium qasimii M12-11B]|uniref:Uncharacterized protein n=1 Tax=Cyclobacterium qasimii M12-11B TaxID=641524 RepID=S7V9C0_9BACT|nr:hypothetical protein ADICYQ_4101 [Cyclobacterium qasimii M12-11B]
MGNQPFNLNRNRYGKDIFDIRTSHFWGWYSSPDLGDA